jgi:hypothetical protein
MTRNTRFAMFALTLGTLCISADAEAQEPPTAQQQAYEQRRAALQAELEATQQALGELRSERVRLATRIENVIAEMMAARARALLMSNETDALQQLDAILTSSQDNLLAQRDRFLAVGEIVRARGGSAIVVLIRADSSEAQRLVSARLQVDGQQVADREYTAQSNQYLALGAVDQVFRSTVLPVEHTIAMHITVDGQLRSETVRVTPARESVTYVQFAVRNGQVTSTTWTSRGTIPF